MISVNIKRPYTFLNGVTPLVQSLPRFYVFLRGLLNVLGPVVLYSPQHNTIIYITKAISTNYDLKRKKNEKANA